MLRLKHEEDDLNEFLKKKHELHKLVRKNHFNQGLSVKTLAVHFWKI